MKHSSDNGHQDDDALLVDIRDVSVDKDLPKEERIAEFVKQVRNPYRFRCGDFVINARYTGSGKTLEDYLQGLIR